MLRGGFLALGAAAVGAQPVSGGGAFWTAEGGGPFREGARTLAAGAAAPTAARLFFAKLGDCSPAVEGTASATPLHFATAAGVEFILQADCYNNLVAFALPDADARPGGALTPLWTWTPPADGPQLEVVPQLTTPVIDEASGTAVFLHKGMSRLFALDVRTAPPTELAWSGLALCNLLPNPGGLTYPPNFCNFEEDHALTLFGGKVWVPSNDYFGILLVDPLTGSYTQSSGLGDNAHRFYGSAGGYNGNWSSVIFNTIGATYGVTAIDRDGAKVWQSSAAFSAIRNEFSHPVLVVFKGGGFTDRCVISSEASKDGGSRSGLYIAGTASSTGNACGEWEADGYYVRHPSIGSPLWVSAPAVLYDGPTAVLLAFAVNRQPGAGSGRLGWRSAVILLQADRSGVFAQPVEFFDIEGAHLNAAPVVLLDAFGAGAHGIAVATSRGELMVFRVRGFTAAGPAVVHDIVSALPAPVAPAAGADLDATMLSAVGNYALVTRGGTVALVSHNAATSEMYLQVVVAAAAPRLASTAPGAARASSQTSVAGAVLGTLGALCVAAAGIVYFLPTAGFSVGATRVVPADVIKHATVGVASGAGWLLSAARSAMGRSAAASTLTSESAAAGEKRGLLSGGGSV